MNKPWDKKKAKIAAAAVATETTTFHAMCTDMNEGPGINDFVIVVTCPKELVPQFTADWDTCQTKAAKKATYSVNDVYKAMAKKGYTITGLFTKYSVGY